MSYIFLGISFIMFLLFMVVFLGYYVYSTQFVTTKKTKTLDEVFEDPNIVREEIRKQTTSCLRTPPCSEGQTEKSNSRGEICCYTDDNNPDISSQDKILNMIQTLGAGFVSDEIKEKIVVHFATKMLERRAEKKMSTQMAKMIAKHSVKITTQTTSKIISKQLVKASAKAAMGPVGWALLVFDLMTMALDMWDPMGYNSWQSNLVWKNIRNKSEATLEEQIRNNGEKYPFLAPYMYDPDKKTQIIQVLFTVSEYLDFLTRLSDDMLTARFGNRIVDTDSPEFIALQSDIETVALAKIDSGEFEQFICRDLKNAGFRVKWIPDLRECSLDEQGCRSFNDYQKTVPEDDRLFAMYTNEYRERDTRDPGDDKIPNMITRKISTPACMVSPLSENATVCKNDSQGSLWNPAAGMCDFSQAHCNRYGLKRVKLTDMGSHTIHNCEMYPGSEFAEFIFGSTITRSAIRGWIELDNALYLNKMREFSSKYIPMYDVPRVIAEELVLKTMDIGAKLVQNLGELALDVVIMAVRAVSRMGERVVDAVHNIVNNPLIVFEDPMMIVDIIFEGLEDVLGLMWYVAQNLFNTTLRILKSVATSFKRIGQTMVDEFKQIGNNIINLF